MFPLENTAKSTRSPSSIKLGLVPTLNEVNGSTLADFSRKETELTEVSSQKQGQRWSCTLCKSVFSLPHMMSQYCSTHPTTPRSRYHLLLSPLLILSSSLDRMIPRQITWDSRKNPSHPSPQQNIELEASTTFQKEAPNYPRIKFIYHGFHSYS